MKMINTKAVAPPWMWAVAVCEGSKKEVSRDRLSTFNIIPRRSQPLSCKVQWEAIGNEKKPVKKQ